MTAITVAALQLALGSTDEQDNIAAVAALVEQAAAAGAQIVLPPELFSGPYFCKVEDDALFATARPTAEHPSVLAMQALARKLKVAIQSMSEAREMVIEGMISIAQGENPRSIESKLQGYLH